MLTKVSVVLSTYNGETYVIEQLDSLRNQIYQPDEVIISDDCSTDNTVSIIETYIKNYNLQNWQLIKNDENQGWRKNFIDLLRIASNDIIFTCDQDDIWDSRKISVMKSIMDEHTEIDLLTCKYTEFYEDGREIDCPKDFGAGLSKVVPNYNIFKIPFPGCSFAIRKSLAKKTCNYWKNSFPHDAIMWRIALLSDSLYVYGEPLFIMRKHLSSSYAIESRKLKEKNVKRDWLNYADETIRTLKEFISNDSINDNKIIDILETNLEFIQCRMAFYDHKSLISAVKLLRYLKCYPAKRQLLADWYLVYLNK